MKHPRILGGAVAAALATVSLSAQADAPDFVEAGQRLRAAIDKTSKLDSMSFKSVESQDDAIRRRMPIGAAEDTQVSGTWSQGTIHASIGFDEDQVVLANGRLLARKTDGDWKLRRACLVDGQPLPFVTDPGLMFAVLANLPAAAFKVTNAEEGKIKDTAVITYGFTLEGEVAEDLALCGIVPRATGGGMMLMIGGGGGGGMSMPKPDVTLDLAVSVDAETGYVARVHCKAYTKSEMPGNVQVRFAGADGVDMEEAAEEPEPAVEDAAMQFRSGLPKRHLGKDTSLTDFDVTLSRHGTAKLPELSEASRKLLGLR